MARTPPWLSKLLLACGGVLVGLMVAEIGLRVLGLPQFHTAHSSPPREFRFVRDNETGAYWYTYAPATTIAFRYDSDPRGYFGGDNTANHVTNSLGFRGPEFRPSPASGTIRLVFVGDSFTFGEGVRFEDTFAEATRRLLADKLRRESGTVESYNLGVGGYNTANELFLLKKIGMPCRPNAVILTYVLNDAEPDLFETDPARGLVRRPREAAIPEGLNDPKPPQTVLYQSRVVQELWRFVASRKLSAQTEAYYHRLYESNAPGWIRTRESLREMSEVFRREKIPFLVMIFPTLHRLGANYPFRDIHELVTSAASSDGAAVLDLLPAFTGKSATDMWVHPTDQHPNEKAHRIAAEQLADRLASWPEFLQTISPSHAP